MATFTPWLAANFPASSQYGKTFLSHCHSSVSRNSGGHGQVIQLGQVAWSLSPGHPEKVTTTGTFSISASRTDFRNAASYSCASVLFGCRGFPWHDSEL